MGLGVLESSQAVVPGTIQLFDNEINQEDSSHLKHSVDGKTILAPQPSDSPNDPLNWSTLKKDTVYLILLVCCILSGCHAAILSPVTLELASEFDVTITKIAQLSSYMLLMIASTSFLNPPIANVYGKRAIFVIGVAILMVADIWAAKSGSYNSLFGARMLSGVGESSFSTLAVSVVPDLYFVHQRSRRILIFVLFSTSGAYLGTVIGTEIIAISSWRGAFIGLAVSEGIMLVLTFLFLHETQYKRQHVDPLANMASDAIMEKVNDPTLHVEEIQPGDPDIERVNTAAMEKKKTFLQNLNLYSGRMSHNNVFLLLYRSIILSFHPTIFYATCLTLLYSWDVGVSFTIDAFMTLPPYNFTTQAVGRMFLAPWIGVILAVVFGEPFLGWLTTFLTRRNHNVYEPEFRLWGTIPGVMLGIIGCVGWGWGEQVGVSWIGMAFFSGIMAAGAVFMNATGVAYIIDAHREYANESQVILFSLKVCRVSMVLICRVSLGLGWDIF
jgi:MFS family permease